MNLEYIYHFTCEECQLWWSIALQEELTRKGWYCPWCGHHQYQEL